MNKIFKRITALTLSAVLLLGMLTGCSVKGTPPPKEVPTTQEEITTEPVFEHEAVQNEIGKAQSLKKNTDEYRYDVFYPVFDIPEVDGVIKGFVNGLVEDFEKNVGSEKHQQGEKITLFADYRVGGIKKDNKERIVSVIFRQVIENPFDNENKDKISVLNFDFEEKAKLKIYDVFDVGFENKLSEALRAELKEYDAFKDNVNNVEFLENTAPKNLKFVEYAFSGTDMIFYFGSGELLKSVKDYVEVIIPVDDIKDIIDDDMLEIILNEDNEKDEDEEETKADIADKKPASQEKVPTFVPKPDKAPSGTKYIAFTFNDGPSEKVTARILDILTRYNCKATFFVSSERLKYSGYTKNLQRAAKMGCEIGSQITVNHASPNDLMGEIKNTNAQIKTITGAEPTVLRAPKSSYKGFEKDVPMPIILWNIDTQDWKYKDKQSVPRSPAQRQRDKNIILSTVVDNVDNGDIILMHDIYDMTADALEEMLPILIKRGYKCVTVSELYKMRGEYLIDGKEYRGY